MSGSWYVCNSEVMVQLRKPSYSCSNCADKSPYGGERHRRLDEMFGRRIFPWDDMIYHRYAHTISPREDEDEGEHWR
jgi:hypothetical protein